MQKLYKIDNWKQGLPDYYFPCPGCKSTHGVWIKPPHEGGPSWNWNGSLEKPTITPSILVSTPVAGKMNICHLFITDGKIQYLGDCTHKLAGQTIEMEDV
jgi:hypothetical protein